MIANTDDTIKDADTWRARADELAAWAWQHLVNRSDVWGGYHNIEDRDKIVRHANGHEGRLGKVTTRPAVKDRGKIALTTAILGTHFRASQPRHVVGLHTTSAQNTSRWGAIEIDRHEESTCPEKNRAAAIALFDRLRRMGFAPLLTDADGKGGYHLRLVFAEPVPTPVVFGFLKSLTAGYAEIGLAVEPETFPKQEMVPADGVGNWLRLPGRHHTRDHWATVWNGDNFVAGDAAVDIVLGIAGDPPSLIPPTPAPTKNATPTNKTYGPDSPERDREIMAEAVRQIPNCEAIPYEGRSSAPSWLGMGMAIHSVDPSGAGLAIWEDWSSQCPEKHDKACTCSAKWSSFSRANGKRIGLGSLINWAKTNGFEMAHRNGTVRAAPDYSEPCDSSVSDDMIDQAPPAEPSQGDAAPATAPEPESDGFRNYTTIEIATKGGQKEKIKVGLSLKTIHDRLHRLTGGWPKVANGMLFAPREDHDIQWIQSASELFAFVAGKLPTGTNILKWAQGDDKPPQSQLYAFAMQNGERFDAVENFPHHPPMARHHYSHPPMRDKITGAFRELIDRYRPATAADRDLIIAAFLTQFAGIEPGQRPAMLVQSTDDDKNGGRGCGKTTLVKHIGQLCGGHVEMRANDEWDTLVTRLLSPAALTRRVAILDNVKTLRFSWADFEAGITAPVISGRQLYVGEGRRPNTLTYFITLNGANMSKDMAQRCVPIVLKRPEYDASWEEKTVRLIDGRRWEIISDIIDILKTPAVPLKRFSRWSAWEQAVLSRVDDPSECQKVIEERQAVIDDDQTDMDHVRDGLREELAKRGHNPDTQIIWMPSKCAAKILNEIENEERRPFNRAMTNLYRLGIPEIRRSNRQGRGCLWTGEQADPQDQAIRLYGSM